MEIQMAIFNFKPFTSPVFIFFSQKFSRFLTIEMIMENTGVILKVFLCIFCPYILIDISKGMYTVLTNLNYLK